MNFEFSEDQKLLKEQANGFLRDNCPPSLVRRVLESGEDHDPELWRKIAEMGWTATVIPEEYGGLGLSYLELAVIAEELGRAVAPVPFSSSVYLATEALLLAGSEDQKEAWLPRLAAGEVIGTLATSEGQGRPMAKNLQTEFKDGRITGTKIPVPDAGIADVCIVLAKSKGGASLYLVDMNQGKVKVNEVPTLDPTRGHGKVRFSGAKAERLGRAGQGKRMLNSIHDRAALLFAWDQVGGSDASMEQAREFALGRYAFGRPIAS